MEFNDTATQLSELLACMSTADTDRRTDLATGLDAFFLIFAGALVLYVGNYIYIIYTLLVVVVDDVVVLYHDRYGRTQHHTFTQTHTFLLLLLLIILLLTALCKLDLLCFVPDLSVPKMPRMVRISVSLSVVYIMEYPQHP